MAGPTHEGGRGLGHFHLEAQPAHQSRGCTSSGAGEFYSTAPCEQAGVNSPRSRLPALAVLQSSSWLLSTRLLKASHGLGHRCHPPVRLPASYCILRHIQCPTGDVGLFVPYFPLIMWSCELSADSGEALVFCQGLKQEVSAVGSSRPQPALSLPYTRTVLWFTRCGP